MDEAIEQSDIVIECTGDVAYGAEAAVAVLGAGKPLVTIDAELQITVGSALARRGYITEAEGDQPGCLAALLPSRARDGVLAAGPREHDPSAASPVGPAWSPEHTASGMSETAGSCRTGDARHLHKRSRWMRRDSWARCTAKSARSY